MVWLKKILLWLSTGLFFVVSFVLISIMILFAIPAGICFSIIIGLVGINMYCKATLADIEDWVDPAKEETEDVEAEKI